jgi:hypothetical protein
MRTSKIAVLQQGKAAKDVGKRRDKDLQEDATFGLVRTLSEKDILRPSVNFISNGGPLIKEKSGEKRVKDKAAENSEAIYVTPAEATTIRPLAASTVQPLFSTSTLSTTTATSTTARPTASVITTTTPAATTGSTVNSAWPMFPLLWPSNAIPVNTHTNNRWQNPPAQPHAFSGQPSAWLLPQQPTAAPAHQQQHQLVHFPLLFLPSMLRASTGLFFPPPGGQQATAGAVRPSATFMLPVQRAPSPAAWGGFLQPQNAFRPPIHPLHNYFFLP